MANRNFASGGKIYSHHVMPVLLDCNFIVDQSNANGLGQRSLKGPAIQNVFMHTSVAPGIGNSNPASPNVVVTNPNPAVGNIVIQLQDKYNRYFSGFDIKMSPMSGAALKIDNSALSQGIAYIISTLGDATAAQWHALGVPAGVTPAAGVSFIAASVGAGANTSSSRVMTTATNGSNIASIELVSDPSLSMNPDPASNQGFGAQLIFQCRDYSGALVNPANDSMISIAMYLSNSSIIVQGE